jgi:hypothetical protein
MKTLFLVLLLSLPAHAAKMVATVKMFRGKVSKVLPNGVKEAIKAKGEKITEGTIISTKPGSFVQLRFIDNSVVNVGPKSEMKIEKFSRNKPGLLSVVKGEIRSQVTKDFLEISKDERDKLYVKSKTAAMGIRGTDFIFSYNQGNSATTAVLLEGEVAFAKVDAGAGYNAVKNAVVNNSVTMYPGEFSVVKPGMRAPTVPAVINIKQKELLVKNRNTTHEKKKDGGRSPASVKEPKKAIAKSTVPPGLSGNIVANEAKGVDEGVKAVTKVDVSKVGKSRGDADGYVKGGTIKPANGSIVHIETGVIIPPSDKSELDKNTNSYVSGGDSQMLTDDGGYKPPEDNVAISDDGKIMVIDENGQQVKIDAPPPILGSADDMGLVAIGPDPSKPYQNDVINKGFVQNGLNDISVQGQNDGYKPKPFDQNSTLIKFNITVQ